MFPHIPPDANGKHNAASTILVRLQKVYVGLILSLAVISTVPAQNHTPPEIRPVSEFFSSKNRQINYIQGALSIPVEWTFTNHGNFPLLIEKIDTSCGCLSPLMDEKQVAPGASGIVRATLTPGTNRGLLRKSLQVRFVGYDQPVELLAETFIPSNVMISHSELIWKPAATSETAATQTVDLTSGTGTSFVITGLVGVQESQFTIVKKIITPEKHYQLHITPATNQPSAALSAALQIRTNSPDPRDQVLIVLLKQSATTP